MKILIVGCGYFGAELANYANRIGYTVYATTRSTSRLASLREMGIEPIVFDWHSQHHSSPLPNVDKVFISVSHSVVQGKEPQSSHVEGLQRLFELLPETWSRCLYLSTTGVFKPHLETRWVDEQSPTGPMRPGSISALAGERWCNEHYPIDRMTILRPAGIYGPGRIPNLESLRSGQPLQVDPHSYLNLIHVADLARIAIELSNRVCQHSVYCVSDGCPVERQDYYDAIATAMGWSPPIFESSIAVSPSSGNRRGQDNKRISNRRLIATLEDYRFLFPTFRKGLLPLLQKD